MEVELWALNRDDEHTDSWRTQNGPYKSLGNRRTNSNVPYLIGVMIIGERLGKDNPSFTGNPFIEL